MKIAAFVNDEGISLPFFAKGTVKIHDFGNEKWNCVKSIPFEVDITSTMPQVRAKIFSLVNEMEDCKIFVAESINGVPFSIFEGLLITIWKLKGKPENHLNYIKTEEERILAEKLKPKPAPVVIGDIRDGIYTMNLIKALESDNSYTSKQLLLPFLQKTTFQRLEVICEHVPKWFYKEFGVLKLKLELQNSTDGLCHAVIIPSEY